MKRICAISILFLLVSLASQAQTYRIVKNDKLSNSDENQLGPVSYVQAGDTGIVFMSNRIDGGLEKVETQYGDPMHPYFYSQKSKPGAKNPREFKVGSGPLPKGEIGPVTFNGDYSRMCIVLPQLNAAGDTDASGFGALFFSEWIDSTWTEPEPFPHNSPEINFNTPCLSPDGQLLFFAAQGDLEGAQGGMDIYYSMFMNGTWSAPVNLGKSINTTEHEMFPFYYQVKGGTNANLRLYFSSNGHNARAGTFDLFYSVFYEGEWLKPLPFPSLNSANYDELSIFIGESLNEGLFTRRDGYRFNIFDFSAIASDYEPFPDAGPMKEASLCYRIYENSMDTIDPEVFEYEWVINDTMRNQEFQLPGHVVTYCFPGPGSYSLSFNVTNKLTDTIIYNAAHFDLRIPEYKQPIISVPDTVVAGRPVYFSAAESNLPEDWSRFEYYWDFGDLTPQGRGENVYHTYKQKGEYRVILGAKKILSRSEERNARNNEIQESEFKMGVIKDIIVLQE